MGTSNPQYQAYKAKIGSMIQWAWPMYQAGLIIIMKQRTNGFVTLMLHPKANRKTKGGERKYESGAIWFH